MTPGTTRTALGAVALGWILASAVSAGAQVPKDDPTRATTISAPPIQNPFSVAAERFTLRGESVIKTTGGRPSNRPLQQIPPTGGSNTGQTWWARADPNISFGAGLTSSNLANQFEENFVDDFSQFDPEIVKDAHALAYQIGLDFALFQHQNHRQLDLRLGGGAVLGGHENYSGSASSQTVTVSNLGEADIDYFYLRAGPSFRASDRVRVWPFYQKGLTKSSGRFEDEARSRSTGQILAGNVLTTKEWRRQHRTIGLAIIVFLSERSAVELELIHSQLKKVFPETPARADPDVDSTTFTASWRVPLRF